jgi:outer membrane protein
MAANHKRIRVYVEGMVATRSAGGVLPGAAAERRQRKRIREEIPMFRVILRVALMTMVIAAALPAAAQTTVALIDVQRVVSESDPGKEAFQKLKAALDAKDAESQAMQKEFETLREQFDKQRFTLSDEKLEEMRKELENKQIALKRFSDDAQRELEAMRRKEMEKLEEKIMPIVNQIGDEKGLTLIFDKYRAGLLYADESVDITDEVIQRFNTAQ